MAEDAGGFGRPPREPREGGGGFRRDRNRDRERGPMTAKARLRAKARKRRGRPRRSAARRVRAQEGLPLLRGPGCEDRVPRPEGAPVLHDRDRQDDPARICGQLRAAPAPGAIADQARAPHRADAYAPPRVAGREASHGEREADPAGRRAGPGPRGRRRRRAARLRAELPRPEARRCSRARASCARSST